MSRAFSITRKRDPCLRRKGNEKIGSNLAGRRVEFIGRPSGRFRNSLREGLSGRRRCGLYVLFDQVPNRCRKQEADQLRAPVLKQGHSGAHDGEQHRVPLSPGRCLHISARNQNGTLRSRSAGREKSLPSGLRAVPTPALARANASGPSVGFTRGARMTVNCPSCNEQIEIPRQNSAA